MPFGRTHITPEQYIDNWLRENNAALDRQERIGSVAGQGFDFSGAPAGTAGGSGMTPTADSGFRLGPIDLSGVDWGNFIKKNWKTLASLALSGAQGVHDYFTETPREMLEKDILASRKARLADLRRHARGDFTPGERLNVQQAYEPVLNRAATSLAARGLAQSGIAARVIAEAEMAPHLQAQQTAQQQLDTYELQSFGLAAEIVRDDPSFGQDVSDIISQLTAPADTTDLEFSALIAKLDESSSQLEQVLEEMRTYGEP